MASKRTSAAVLAMLLLGAGAGSAVAQANKKDLYSAAEAAAASGNIEESQKGYCKVAKLDPKFKDAKLLCSVMTEELERERKKNEDRFNQGVKEFNGGRFDYAQHEFANIRWGAHLEEAKLYLTIKIPQARDAAKNQNKSR